MSWGHSGSAIGDCACLHSYPQAQRHFEDRGAGRSARWAANERPLNKTRHNYLKVVQGEPDIYDLVLYNTPLVRYFKPHLDGSYDVWLRGYDTTSSWDFLAQMQWNTQYRTLRTTHGLNVYAPLASRLADDKDWSAKLRFAKTDELIVSESVHAPVCTFKSSQEDKLARAEALRSVRSVVDLLVVRIPYMHQHSRVSTQNGAPFTGVDLGCEARDAVRALLSMREKEVGAALFCAAQSVYDSCLAHREWRCSALPISYAGQSGSDLEPVAPETFRKSLRSFFVRVAGLDKRSEPVILPQFPEHLPRKYYPV